MPKDSGKLISADSHNFCFSLDSTAELDSVIVVIQAGVGQGRSHDTDRQLFARLGTRL